MPTLVVDVGGSPITLDCQRAGKAEPVLVGQLSRAFGGAERSAVVAASRIIALVTAPVSAASEAAVQARFANAAQVACSGDVFNNGGATVFCSAKISAELQPAAGRWVLSITLSEVGATSVLDPVTVWLNGNADPAHPGAYLAAFAPSGPILTPDMLAAAVPATCAGSFPACCAITYSAAPEVIFWSVALAAGNTRGQPRARFDLSVGGTADRWCFMSTKAVLYHARGGVDIGGPWETPYVNSDFFYNPIVLPFNGVTALNLQAGDLLRMELWSRLGLVAGMTDNGMRQEIRFGGNTFGVGTAALEWSGALAAL